MQGKSLPINFSSFVHMVQSIGGTDRPTISLSRSFTRLKTVFATFYKQPLVIDYRDDGGVGEWGQYMEIPNMTASHLPLREFNFFYHPQYLYPGNSLLNPGGIDGDVLDNGYWTFQYRTEPEMQLQVGSKLFPESPMMSSAEMYYHLRKSLGSHHPGSQYAVNILDKDYRSTHFIVAFDCEKQTNVGFSGINTRAGDLICIKGLNLVKKLNDGTVLAGTTPDFIHTTLEYDGILVISDSGVTVLE